jgi:hypothetical protein
MIPERSSHRQNAQLFDFIALKAARQDMQEEAADELVPV